MILHSLLSAIASCVLSKQDRATLVQALAQFNEQEQHELLQLSQKNKDFWYTLVTEMNVLKKKMSVGAAASINADLKQLLTKLQ